jgi:geranylgeranyl diphosphate synthase type I
VDARLEELLAREPAPLRGVLGPALAGGKRLRPAVLLLVHDALGPGEAGLAEDFAAGLELVHTATLIHDDLLDGDEARRGQPATHARLRAAAGSRAQGLATLAGDAALAWGAALLREPEAALRLHRALQATWLGAWHEALPGSLAHEDVARLKTAALFRLAGELGALAARAGQEQEEAAGAFGEHLGLAYQMADDLADAPQGAPDPDTLRRHALAEAERARAAARTLPAGPARDALVDAPGALLAALVPRTFAEVLP